MKQIGNYTIDTDLYYDGNNHFWLRPEGNITRIGFSPLLQETSGSFVAIVFDNINKAMNKGDFFGSVEAEKHVAQLTLPISGEVIAINEKVIENPRLMNDDPYGDGWLIEIKNTCFQNEKTNLIHGEEDICEWIHSELKKYNDKGWIARP